MNKTVQAKHISTDDVLAFIRSQRAKGQFTNVPMLTQHLNMPYKVVMAKITKLDKQKIIQGCGCGCGSPMWELDANGKMIA